MNNSTPIHSTKDDRGNLASGTWKDALAAVDAALKGADPARMVEGRLRLSGDTVMAGNLRYNLDRYGRVFVMGAGKASGRMAMSVEKVLGKRIDGGMVIVPHYQKGLVKTDRIEITYGGHPVPDEAGLRGVTRIFEMIGAPRPDDLVICLISGGGSSLLSLPAEGIGLDDVSKVTKVMLDSGADIHELNIVRKHLSGIHGGRLAERLYPATILSLIVSDVVGNDLETISSGPTFPDTSTFSEAISVLKKRGAWESCPSRVRRLLEHGISGSAKETPKPGSEIFQRVQNLLIGDNFDACAGAQKELTERGYSAFVLTTEIEGEARTFGAFLSSLARGIADGRSSLHKPAALIFGGETTVKVTGQGKGGRNQEVALSASSGISSLPGVVVCSFGTDGVDGVTDAAGAIVDGSTYETSRSLGLDIDEYLQNNDSYTLLKATRSLLTTGPTGTNVGDVMMVVAGRV